MRAVVVAALAACAPQAAPGPSPSPPSTTEAAPNDAGPDAPTADATVPTVPSGLGGRPRVVVTESDKCGFLLDKLYFARGSATLGERQKPILEATAWMFRCMVGECPTTAVEVGGHASAREAGPEALSMQRARAVRDALVARGVDPDMLSTKAYAALAPIDTRPGEEAMLRNQRVEFRVDQRACRSP